MNKLSPAAQKIINEYLWLPLPGYSVNTPYFNNKRANMRAALRVLIGKGSPQDIAEEARVIALRDHADLKTMNDENLKRFLVDHNLGVDCSALAYYISDAECRAKGLGALKKHLTFTNAKNPFRKILARLRPAENTSVAVLADDANSKIVSIEDIQPGDMILLWKTREDHALNHLLFVHDVQKNMIFYTHSFRWSKDGAYDHGVRQGTITIRDFSKPLSEQIWEEKNETGENNETLKHVRLARLVEIRRFLW